MAPPTLQFLARPLLLSLTLALHTIRHHDHRPVAFAALRSSVILVSPQESAWQVAGREIYILSYTAVGAGLAHLAVHAPVREIIG